MNQEMYDVIVIGAGPSGGTVAYEIAKAGYQVLLLERDSYPGENNSCGGGIGAFMQKKFALPDSIIHKRIHAVRLDLGDREKTYQAARPIYLSIKRTEFDSFLAERAESAGAELRCRQAVKGYDPLTKTVTILDRDTGARYGVQGRLVIFADGPRSLAWKELGLGVDPNRDPAVGLAYELGYPGNAYDAFEFIFNEKQLPYGYFWVFPTTDTLNVGVGGPVRDLGQDAKQVLLDFIASRADLRDLKPVRKTAGMIPTYVSSRLHGDGVLVVGDAGGFVNPLTGGGLYLGMSIAQMAAQTAREALRERRTDAAFLAKYTWRVKFSPIYSGLKTFHALVAYSQRHRERTGRPILGKIFKLYSDVGNIALRRL